MHFISEISFQVHVDAVEIDEAIARVAKEQFGFEECDRVKLHIEDGLKFVAAAAGKSSSHFMSFYCSLLTQNTKTYQYLSKFVGE